MTMGAMGTRTGPCGVACCVLVALALLAVPVQAPLAVSLDQGRVPALWDADWSTPEGETRRGVTGQGVVAFLGEGFSMAHPDLGPCGDLDHHAVGAVQGQVINRPRNDNRGHGNLVVGVLCGSGAQSQGRVRGVAHGATVLSAGGPPGAGVGHPINFFCLGGSGCPLGPWFTEHDVRVYSSSNSADPVQRATELFGAPSDADILFVQAAGNSGGDGSTSRTQHCDADPRLLCVAAGNGNRTDVADYSSRGDRDDPSTWPDLVAPGCVVTTLPHRWIADHAVTAQVDLLTGPDDRPDCPAVSDPVLPRHLHGYARTKGTSFAAPFVSGVAALVFEVNPGLSALDARYLLTRTAEPFIPSQDLDGDGQVGPAEFRQQHGYKAGYGFVNATAATAAAHYKLLHTEASLDEAIDCSTTGRTGDGRLVLNPGGGGCSSS